MPTFAHLAGVPLDAERPIDGVNIWPALSTNRASPRTEVLGHLDDDIGYAVIIANRWKYVNGTTNSGRLDKWLSDEQPQSEIHPASELYGQSVWYSVVGRTLQPYLLKSSAAADNGSYNMFQSIVLHQEDATVICDRDDGDAVVAECVPMREACLFDIIADPCERVNLASVEPNILADMETRLKRFRATVVTPRNRPSDARSNPKYFNGTWTWWYDELQLSDSGEYQRNTASSSRAGSSIFIVWIIVLTELIIIF